MKAEYEGFVDFALEVCLKRNVVFSSTLASRMGMFYPVCVLDKLLVDKLVRMVKLGSKPHIKLYTKEIERLHKKIDEDNLNPEDELYFINVNKSDYDYFNLNEEEVK